MKFKVNNRLDIYDIKDRKWREVFIVDLKDDHSKGTAIKVRFKGYTAQYDDWIDCNKEAARIKEVGSFSGAEGFAKYSSRFQQELHDDKENINARLNKIEPPRVLDGSGWGLRT